MRRILLFIYKNVAYIICGGFCISMLLLGFPINYIRKFKKRKYTPPQLTELTIPITVGKKTYSFAVYVDQETIDRGLGYKLPKRCIYYDYGTQNGEQYIAITKGMLKTRSGMTFKHYLTCIMAHAKAMLQHVNPEDPITMEETDIIAANLCITPKIYLTFLRLQADIALTSFAPFLHVMSAFSRWTSLSRYLNSVSKVPNN